MEGIPRKSSKKKARDFNPFRVVGYGSVVFSAYDKKLLLGLARESIHGYLITGAALPFRSDSKARRGRS